LNSVLKIILSCQEKLETNHKEKIFLLSFFLKSQIKVFTLSLAKLISSLLATQVEDILEFE
jgi:hypothetical protein